MLEFSDASYRFFPAKPSPFLIRVGRALNRHLILPGKNHRIADIRIEGESEAIREAKARGERLVFVANHPSHSDPQVVTEVQRRLGIGGSFMAAYDVFLRSRFTAWSMQRLGHFSVDREAADRKAMAAAIATVTTGGPAALSIFPEGNVYLTNDRVTPFLDGAAFIALKAQQALDGIPVRIVPVSLKFTHLTAPRGPVRQRLVELGRDSGHAYAPGSSADPLGAVLGLGRHLLGSYLQKHRFLEKISHGDSLHEVLERFAVGLVARLEESLGISTPKAGGLVERIRKVRSTVHQMRTDPSGAAHPEIDGCAERAILAFRVHGYLTPYLTDRPTVDRYDETVERLAEDFYSRAMPRTGPRRAIVRFQGPLDVSSFLSEAGSLRNAVAPLTRAMEAAVQSGVDAINASNDTPGAELVPEFGNVSPS